MCLQTNQVTTATVVDHIKPHKGNKQLFWDCDNWQALCVPCHNSKTSSQDFGYW
ncbi:HNH endonuclease signature motif containing protein [Paenibacillus sp. MDMC362]|uniref:HNH endonuclease signature motif containing protein n=1 Tax=Paenibacillus sp. MDMC362 TaxID=2977365 RepID=UPI002795A68B|nr:HNH endonuclease signature motif containing protein [Paenibacillus sp. MDMC362]